MPLQKIAGSFGVQPASTHTEADSRSLIWKQEMNVLMLFSDTGGNLPPRRSWCSVGGCQVILNLHRSRMGSTIWSQPFNFSKALLLDAT